MEEIVTRRILPTCWTRQIIETRFGFAPPAITKSRFIGRCSIEVFTTLREPCSKVEVVPTSQLRAFSGIKIPLTNKESRVRAGLAFARASPEYLSAVARGGGFACKYPSLICPPACPPARSAAACGSDF